MAVQGIKWVRNAVGSPQVVRIQKEYTGQTFKAGHILVWDTTDETVKAASDSAVAAYGIALEDASGTEDEELHVGLIMPGDIYSATISAAGANSTSAHDLDAVGLNYSWILSTETSETTKITIDKSDTGNAWVTVLDLDPRDAAGTSGGRVLFTFLPAVYDVRAV